MVSNVSNPRKNWCPRVLMYLNHESRVIYREREKKFGSFGKDMEMNSSHSNSMLGHSN